MKAGFGNCFLRHAVALGGLVVLYDGSEIPQVDCEGSCTAESKDLRHLKLMSMLRYREQVRVLCFGKDSLHIFKITGDLCPIPKNQKAIDWTKPETYGQFPSPWVKGIRKSYGKYSSQEYLDYIHGPMGFKFLPATPERTILRGEVYAAVDSLSVWQAFSRRTFQPIFEMYTGSPLSGLEWLKGIPDLAPMKLSSAPGDELLETPHGKFVRLYLNQLTGRASENIFSNLSDADMISTLVGSLNPAQVETAAMLMCLDLGLTIDVGVGKGLDVADSRATVRHLDKAKGDLILTAAIQRLQDRGVRFSTVLLEQISMSRTLRIQCTASANTKKGLGTVLLLEPFGSPGQPADLLRLDELLMKGLEDLPRLADWLALIRTDLTGC